MVLVRLIKGTQDAFKALSQNTLFQVFFKEFFQDANFFFKNLNDK